MNFIKGLLGFGGRPRHISNFLNYKAEARLFIIDQGIKKCVFNFCQVSFMQENEYDRFIYIKNLSRESQFKADDYAFPIKEDMNMRSYEYKEKEHDIVGFEWDNDDNEVMCLEFGTHINDDLVPAMDFRYYICRLIFESKFKETAAEATEEELHTFCRSKEEHNNEQESQSDSQSQNLYPELSGPYTESNPSTLISHQSKPSKPLVDNRQQVHEESKQNSQSFPDFGKVSKENGIPLFEMKTNLYELNINGDPALVLPHVTFTILNANNFRYYLELFDKNMKIVYKRAIKDDLRYHVDERKRYFTWAEAKPKSQEVSVFACNITEDLINQLNSTMARCVYEATNQESIEEAFKKPEEQQFVRRWFERDIEKMEEEVEEAEHQSSGEMEISNIYISSRDKPSAPNTGQVQAKLLDRAFVSQGPVISVFMNNDEDNTFERILSLPPVQTLEGVDFYPKKMMMHQQDTKMLLLSDPENTKVYYMDIARGKIINEYEGDNINRFTDIGPTSKHAELTHNPCFLASNSKNLFLFDPRVSDKNKVVAEKTYATNPKFTCITTSDTENMFATGSEKGEIRLYTKMGQNAKTLFPGFGSPIISLDSTNDGAWLLATTKTYLMLFQTISNGKNGYKHSISKEPKVPFKLTILPEDMKKYRILEIDFKPAKFNDNERDGDRFIVASTGNLLVSWSLKNILRGNPEKYEIRKIEDYIVSNEFRYKKEEDLLLTLPGEVRVQKAKFY